MIIRWSDGVEKCLLILNCLVLPVSVPWVSSTGSGSFHGSDLDTRVSIRDEYTFPTLYTYYSTQYFCIILLALYLHCTAFQMSFGSLHP